MLWLCALGGFAMAAVASPDDGIRWHDCPAGARAGQSAAVMRCGVFISGVTLNGKPVRLRLTRLQAHPEGPTPHPVIHVPGGPGDRGGQSVPELQAWRRFQQIAGWPRDLVIFDPRGTGLSAPKPICPSDPGSDDARRLAICYARLGATTAAGLGAHAQVVDLHRLITALDQGGAVLWAESYGALIARRLAAEHPSDVRMLILDSPVLRPRSAGHRQAAAFRRRRAQLLRGCDRVLACRLAVPSLGVVIDGLIGARHHHPAKVAVARPPRRARTIDMDGRTVRSVLLLSVYGDSDDRRVRRLLRQALDQPSALAGLAAPLLALAQRRQRTAPVYWSTRCQFAPVADGPEAAGPQALCRQWPVARLAVRRGTLGVPTLVVAGTRDVLTPAAAAARAVLAHPGWQFLPVDGGGHGALQRNRCAQRMAARYMTRDGAWLGALYCHASPDWTDKPQRKAAERGSNDVAHASR